MKLVRDFLALASGQVLSKLIIFGAFAWLSRKLDPQSYGYVEFAVALSLFATMVVDLGLGAIGARELAKDPKKVESLTATIPAARLLMAVVVVPIMGFCAQLMGQSEETVTLVWLMGLALLALPWKQDWLLQGLEMMEGVAIGDVVRAGVFTIGVIVFVHSPRDLVRVGFAEIIAAVSAALFYIGFQYSRIGPVRLRFSIQQIRSLFSQASFIGLSQVVWAINQYVQLILLAWLVGGEKTAYFGVSHRIVASLLIFSNVYHFNLFPALVRASLESTESLERLVRASSRIVAWTGILVAVFFTLCAQPVLEFVFGEQYGEGATALTILIWALPITALSGHARRALIAKNRQKQMLFAQLAGTGVTLLVTPFLIWQYEATGAAVGMVAGNLTVWFVAQAFARIHVGQLPFVRSLARPAALAILVAVLSVVLGSSVWVTVVLLVAAAACAPLGDRELIPDLKRLAHAKSNSNNDASIDRPESDAPAEEGHGE